jgi:hypothetical protein
MIFVENQVIKIENGITYLKLSNLSNDKIKLNQVELGSVEKISNSEIKSLNSPELSVNFTSSHEHLSSLKPQPQEEYGMTKTDFLQQFDLKHLPENVKTRVENILWDFKWTFARHKSDYGLTHLITHKISTEGPPIKKSPYKTPYHLKPWLESQIKEMEDQGIIKESISDWCFPLVIVRKKDNTWRLCIDFRSLNAVTVKDVMKLPRIDTILI